MAGWVGVVMCECAGARCPGLSGWRLPWWCFDSFHQKPTGIRLERTPGSSKVLVWLLNVTRARLPLWVIASLRACADWWLLGERGGRGPGSEAQGTGDSGGCVDDFRQIYPHLIASSPRISVTFITLNTK